MACVHFISFCLCQYLSCCLCITISLNESEFDAHSREFHEPAEVCVVVVVVVVVELDDIEARLECVRASSKLLVIIIVVLVMCELIRALDCSAGACCCTSGVPTSESEKNAPASVLLMLEVDEAGLGVSAALPDWLGDVALKLTECKNL